MIRYAKLKDAKKIVEIYNYYILNTTVTFEVDKLSVKNFKKRMKSILKKYPFIVYEKNDEILGYAYLSEFNPRAAYYISADLSIYVKNDIKAKGIGTSLYTYLENVAKEKGIENIISLVTSENETSSKFHLKNGFNKCGELNDVAFKFNKLLGLNYYIKRIKNEFKN